MQFFEAGSIMMSITWVVMNLLTDHFFTKTLNFFLRFNIFNPLRDSARLTIFKWKKPSNIRENMVFFRASQCGHFEPNFLSHYFDLWLKISPQYSLTLSQSNTKRIKSISSRSTSRHFFLSTHRFHTNILIYSEIHFKNICLQLRWSLEKFSCHVIIFSRRPFPR